MLRIWPFQLVNHYETADAEIAAAGSDLTYEVNKYFWITFNLLKTYLLFILLIEKTYIALPKLLL